MVANFPANWADGNARRAHVRGGSPVARSTAANEESPLAIARRRRFSLQFHTYSESTRKHLTRVTNASAYPVQLAEMLDHEHASFKVCRWVAWGNYLQDRAVRWALALLLRHEAAIDNPRRAASGWVWPKDHLLRASEKLFWQSPQCARLVKTGILSKGVSTDGKHLFNAMWDQTWAAIQREFATFDREAFAREVHAAAAQRRRRRVKKRLKLKPHERAYVDALDTIKRGVLRGDITVDEALTIEQQAAPTTGATAPTERKRAR